MFSLSDAPHKDLTDGIKALLCTDIIGIIDFLVNYYNNLSNANKLSIHNFVYRIQRLPFNKQISNLSTLNDLIENDSAFKKFRIFYGDDLYFFPNFDFEKAEQFRLSMIDNYVNEIECETLNNWYSLFNELLLNDKQYSGLYFSQKTWRRIQ